MTPNAINSDEVYANGHQKFKMATLYNVLLTPANTIQSMVAAVAGKKIRLLWVRYSSTTAVAPSSGQFISGTSPTILAYLGGFSGGATPIPTLWNPLCGFICETAKGEALGFRNTATATGDLCMTYGYVEVPA